jgi:hypothetical protein
MTQVRSLSNNFRGEHSDYLIVDPEKRVIVHHERAGTDIRIRIVGEDTRQLRFDPPGFAVSVAALLE